MGSNYAELHLISALHYLTPPLSGLVVSLKLASFEFKFFFTIILKVSVARKKVFLIPKKHIFPLLEKILLF